MVKKVTLGMLMLLLFGMFAFNLQVAKAQTASPSQAVITVSGVPSGTTGLAVEVTVDTAVVTLGSASSDVSGGLVVVGSMSEGVGVIGTSGDLPASFAITVPLTGVVAGTSMVAVGNVLDMLGGTAIVGASASVDVSSVTVSGTAPTPTPPPTGMGGNLSADTFTVTINGDAVNATNALNVTIGISDSTVVVLDTGVTFMGTGATQLLTDVNTTTNILTVVWDGSITDGAAVITGMLKPGTTAGIATLSVTKVEAAGSNDITGSVIATVSPNSITNSSEGGTSTDVGTFTLVGPSSVRGPGQAAIALSGEDTPDSFMATLNGESVSFTDDTGVAIVDLPASGTLDLDLKVTAGGMTTDVSLGSITVTAGDGGKLPKVSRAKAKNGSANTKLTVNGKKFVKDSTTVTIVPTDATATDIKVSGKKIKATYSSDDCISKGSFVNVSTPSGTDAKKISVKGSCE